MEIALAFLIALNANCYAEDLQVTDDLLSGAKGILLEGPYEYQDGTGIVGYVVSRLSESLVEFKPCSGNIVKIDKSKLKLVKTGCSSEPSPGNTMVQLSCPAPIPKIEVLKQETTKPTGTTYTLEKDEVTMAGQISSDVKKSFDGYGFKGANCGADIVFWGDATNAGLKNVWVGVVKPEQMP
jgi:hypothetical protein